MAWMSLLHSKRKPLGKGSVICFLSHFRKFLVKGHLVSKDQVMVLILKCTLVFSYATMFPKQVFSFPLSFSTDFWDF